MDSTRKSVKLGRLETLPAAIPSYGDRHSMYRIDDMISRSPQMDPVVQEFLGHIEPIRRRLERLILFGSRARGDNNPYSDYDILVVMAEKDRTLIDALYDATMEVLYKTGRLISLKVYRKADFD